MLCYLEDFKTSRMCRGYIASYISSVSCCIFGSCSQLTHFFFKHMLLASGLGKMFEIYPEKVIYLHWMVITPSPAVIAMRVRFTFHYVQVLLMTCHWWINDMYFQGRKNGSFNWLSTGSIPLPQPPPFSAPLSHLFLFLLTQTESLFTG